MRPIYPAVPFSGTIIKAIKRGVKEKRDMIQLPYRNISFGIAKKTQKAEVIVNPSALKEMNFIDIL